MQLRGKPIAFVDESGYIIPTPNFTPESLKHVKGRFIYSNSELEMAIREMNERTDMRREVADRYYGAEATRAKTDEFDTIGDVISNFDGERETVPSFTASMSTKRKTGSKSQKLTQPNLAPLPETLNKEPQGINLTQEELDEFTGVDTAGAVAAMFGDR